MSGFQWFFVITVLIHSKELDKKLIVLTIDGMMNMNVNYL